MSRPVISTHRIVGIKPREGKYIHSIHVVMQNSDCIPVDITPGRNGLIAVERADSKGELHSLLTSPIERVEMRHNDGMDIITKNTIYTVRKLRYPERKVFLVTDYWHWGGEI